MREIAGKVAFITGAASGIGKAMAHSFSRAGMKVILTDIEESALLSAQREFEHANAEFLAFPLDVGDRQAMARAADAAESRFGKVHVVCNNAGVVVSGQIQHMSYDDWDWVLGVNLQGVVNGVQVFTERMLSHGEGGHFINTASMTGFVSVPGMSVYAATKSAVVALSETMRVDLADRGIGVSIIAPGMVLTNIFDAARNRPSALSDTRAAANQSREDSAAQEAAIEALRRTALTPDVVADMALHALIENEFYIFPHPEIQAMFDARHQEMRDAFERWQKYRKERGI